MMNGLVLDLVRLSVHDGPGIRTTVFLKGCPLQCRWCHNPESVVPSSEIGFRAGQCVACGGCAKVCPQGVHRFEKGQHLLERSRCIACGACVEACLPGALRLFGQMLSAEQVAASVLADRTFYAQSGGGCTLSGGEPLWQAAFCAEVLQLLGEAGLHRAVDTSGAAPWEAFGEVLPHTDLFLYDLKHTDDALHREWIGSSNTEILNNLRHLSERGLPIEVRIPLIPGFNADEASLHDIGEFLRELPNLVGVRLLPYHLARSKYEALGRGEPMPDTVPPTAAVVLRAAEVLRGLGLTVPPLP